MDIATGLPAFGLTTPASAHAILAQAEATDRASQPVPVKYDDLDLSSLDGVLELQDRLEQAIADACWRSTGSRPASKARAAACIGQPPATRPTE
jgi:UrcA family protein